MRCYGKRSVCLVNRGTVYQYLRLITCYRCVPSLVFKLSYQNSFENWVPVNVVYGCSWVLLMGHSQKGGWPGERMGDKGWEGGNACSRPMPLRWRHNGRDSVSNHQPHDCLLNRLFRRRSKKTSKLRITGLCAGNSPGTGEFPVQMASNAENVSIWWRHHGTTCFAKYLAIQTALRIMDGRQATRHALMRTVMDGWLRWAPEASEQGYGV